MAMFFFQKLYPEQVDFLKDLQRREAFAYDCLFTIALSLNASIVDLQQLKPPRGLDEFSYEDKEMARVLLNNTYKTEFVGLTVS